MIYDQKWFQERKEEIVKELQQTINEYFQEFVNLAVKATQKRIKLDQKYNEIIKKEEESKKVNK
jgi:hypothetical protein